MKNIKAKIELFQKIDEVHFATDYSSIDHLYPPLFAWRDAREGNKIQRGEFFQGLKGKNDKIYVHFPFCRYKCSFCRQFSIVANKQNCYDDFVDLLIRELKLYVPYFRSRKLSGIYFGGGTPTLFNLKRVLEEIYRDFNLSSSFYLNIESTPDSLDQGKLLTLKKIGLTRLLIGVQSFDPLVLRTIGRPVLQRKIFQEIYKRAREVNIPFLNVELVCGLPRQTLESFIDDLKYTINFRPDSIHIYPYLQTPLTIVGREKGAPPLSQLVLTRKMYDTGFEILNRSGYIYRGDDFASNDAARNPVLMSITGDDNLVAVGPSSIGFYYLSDGVLRTFNTLDLTKYKRTVLKGLFPIEKFYPLISRDEFLRVSLIWFYRYGRLSATDLRKTLLVQKPDIIKSLLSYFKKEFSFLEKTEKVEINADLNEIRFKRKGMYTYSKIFYSPQVLRRCREIIKKKYSHLVKDPFIP